MTGHACRSRLWASVLVAACAAWGISACEIEERPSDERPAVQTSPVPESGT